MLFDHSGKVISHTQKEHEQIFPRTGWIEHDPIEIWERTQEVILIVREAAEIQVGEMKDLIMRWKVPSQLLVHWCSGCGITSA